MEETRFRLMCHNDETYRICTIITEGGTIIVDSKEDSFSTKDEACEYISNYLKKETIHGEVRIFW